MSPLFLRDSLTDGITNVTKVEKNERIIRREGHRPRGRRWGDKRESVETVGKTKLGLYVGRKFSNSADSEPTS